VIRVGRSSTPSEPRPAELSQEKMRSGIDRLKRKIAELEAFEVGTIAKRNDPRVIALETSIEEVLERIFGAGTIEKRRYSPASRLHHQIVALSSSFGRGGGPSSGQVQQEFSDLREKSIALLNQAVKGLEEELAEHAHSPERRDHALSKTASRKVFVVHGHDDGAREAVARFLEKIDFTPIILHEQPNQGRTIIEKFEAHADVGFAVVLLTPDDMGSPREGAQQPQPRARQNVVLELGYFIGKLGRDHVCAIKSGELEMPSDILGVVWTPFDISGAWRAALAKELQAAGHEIDWNKAMR